MKVLAARVDPRIVSIVADICITIDSPRSLAVFLCITNGQFDELARFKTNPLHYFSSDAFRDDYLVTSVLKKIRDIPVQGADPSKASLDLWFEVESKNKVTNDYFRKVNAGIPLPAKAHAVFEAARAKISSVLGRFSYTLFQTADGWGPGASLGLPRRVSRFKKKTQKMTVSHHARSLALLDLSHDPHWFEALTGVRPEGPYAALPSCMEVVDYARWDTVPKTTLIDRVINVEPTANMLYQRALGGYIRKRLKSFGVDLDDQSRNQQGALSALSEGLATIDLSSASDTITTELCKYLLPPEWFDALDRVRSRRVKLPDETIHLTEKFVSMGNGYAFELESLIFWALVSAYKALNSCRSSIILQDGREVDLPLVYGDDIVIDASAYSDVVDILELAGFSVNRDKSFSTNSRFFESCGKHYFDGADVTPVFQKDVVKSLGNFIRFHNRLYRWSQNDHRFQAVLYEARYSSKTRQPDGLEGDFGFLSPRAELEDFPYDANRGYKIPACVATTTGISFSPSGFLAMKLRRPVESLVRGKTEVRSSGFAVKRRWFWPVFAT